MSNIKQARIILRHGVNADFDSSKIETAELVFAEDTGALYIKKKDGSILSIGPYIESYDNKVVDSPEDFSEQEKKDKYPSIAYLESAYFNKEDVAKKIKEEMSSDIRGYVEDYLGNHSDTYTGYTKSETDALIAAAIQAAIGGVENGSY